MKAVIVCDEKSGMRNAEFRRQLGAAADCEIVYLDGVQPMYLFGKIKELSPDILITTDLIGFEQITLTDNLSYNLLDCKQIHLLLHEKLRNEHSLQKQLSIAMFFYCVGDEYYEYLIGKYPQLPYLQTVAGWREEKGDASCAGNAGLICEIIKELITKCKL